MPLPETKPVTPPINPPIPRTQYEAACHEAADAYATWYSMNARPINPEDLVYIRIGKQEFQIPPLMLPSFFESLGHCWREHLSWATRRIGDSADWETTKISAGVGYPPEASIKQAYNR